MVVALGGGFAGTIFMIDVLGVTLPFFALVGLGFWAARARLLPVESLAGLNAFVLYFALPCMLFEFGQQTPLAQLLHPVVVTVWLAAALGVIALGLLWSRHAGHARREGAFVALVSTFPNSGFMGVPLLTGLLGVAAAGPTIAAVVLDMVVTSSICIALAHAGRAAGSQGAHSGWTAVRQALLSAARNPMPWAVVAGAGCGALGWALPKPVATTVSLLAHAATPAALFCIGGVLWRTQLLSQQPNRATAGASGRDTQPPIWGSVLLKLLVHPALVAAGLGLAGWLGHGLPQTVALALTLVAALPGAGNVALLAERFGGGSGAVARITLWTTVWALLSFNAVVGLLWRGA